MTSQAIASNEGKTTKWTFIEYKTEQKAMLEMVFPTEVIDMVTPAPTACKDCISLKEAFIDPEMVVSITISATITGEDIESLPDSIGRFKNLKYLYLSDHSLNSIPKEMGELTQLEELSIEGCNLTELPKEFFKLKNLKEAFLYDNNFSEDYIKKMEKKFRKKMPNTVVEWTY